ncbi:MAG TPA: peptide deformylase [Thermoanaerobaculia bacterium]|nr:peptide deformylase [Thermoanaerobaculia bacterium]
MAVLPIVRLGHPVLREVAQPLDPRVIASKDLQAFLDDLFETMVAARGVGLAAPQVGAGVRIFVYGAAKAEIAERVVINPRITFEDGELASDWEGCLSIPGLRGLVPRHERLRLSALGRDGRPYELVAEGFEARIIQHELDHLDGIVFLDRMRDLRSLAFNDEQGQAQGNEPEPDDDSVA